MAFGSINPGELYERIRSGESVDLIDVRSPQEYKSVHAAGARLLPLDKLTKDAVLAACSASPQQPVYVICQSGGRSRTACARLVEQGLNNVVNVEGGTTAWQQAGLPVEVTVSAGSNNLFRTAGLLCMIASLVLALTVNPVFGFGAVVAWLFLVLTGNAPCCSGSTCSTRRQP